VCVGVVVYLSYGMRHSVEARSSLQAQHVPDEQQILLPLDDDDDHVTRLPDDVTSGRRGGEPANSAGTTRAGRL